MHKGAAGGRFAHTKAAVSDGPFADNGSCCGHEHIIINEGIRASHWRILALGEEREPSGNNL